MKEQADLEAALAACADKEDGLDAPPPLPPPADTLPPIADEPIDAGPVPVPHDGALYLDPTPSGCVLLTRLRLRRSFYLQEDTGSSLMTRGLQS